MTRVSLVVTKTLFARSCNRCAFPGCDNRLTDPQWGGVRADVAHIHGEKPGAARYAPEMSETDRNAVENLMLLCPNHHREIDRLQPQDWPAERLMEIKSAHEASCGSRNWASDATLEFVSSLLISSEQAPAPERSERSRLTIESGSGDTFEVVNVGDVDAFDVRIQAAPGVEQAGLIRLEDSPLRRLSPGGRWRAGLYGRTMGDHGTPVLQVQWTDTGGETHEAELPL